MVQTPDLNNLVIGIAGTGRMAQAHAYRWSSYGIKVLIGSRDPAKGRELAQRIGGKCEGGGHVEMLRASDLIILAIYPGKCSTDFIDTYREEIVGKGKMFLDMTVAYSRFGSPSVRGPKPYADHVNWLKDRLNDPTASWVKAMANLMARSIYQNKVQPVEVAGDEAAKEVIIRLLEHAGWEPLDCGTAADIPKIEPGFHENRWRHPRHLEFNGPNHP